VKQMKLTNRHVKASGIVHGLAYIIIIVNLLLMNLNVLIGKPLYIFANVSLGLIAILLCLVVLLIRKGTDSTPLFGVIINVYSIIVVMGTVFFYEG